jgi:hypothetical protein
MPNTSETGSRGREEVAEEEGPCWYDLGSFHHDDARSWSSHGGDRHRSTSSAKSGSVGSNDEGNAERGHYRGSSSATSFRAVGYASYHAAHMVNGETKFPTATSYVSDAQRSDVATVCSGSVVEDIEVESVVSQEDHLALAASSPSNHRSRPFPGANRVVEFAGLPAAEPPDKYPLHDRSSPPQVPDVNTMGPPLSRALLLRAEGGASSSRAGSVKSFGSTGSEPGESKTPRIACTSSNLSYGGGDDGPFENEMDEAGSLDVETHSIGTRSVHSQDDAAAYGEDDVGFDRQPSSLSISDAVADSRTAGTLAEVERNVNGGRQSPGGTIYKGRGTRRYQGRYMHLPLKRFHHDGVHLEAFDGENPHSVHARKRPYAEQYDSRWNDRQSESDESNRGRQRFRSRSRSRSPAEEDRKPSASNHSRSDQPHRASHNRNTSRDRQRRRGASNR